MNTSGTWQNRRQVTQRSLHLTNFASFEKATRLQFNFTGTDKCGYPLGIFSLFINRDTEEFAPKHPNLE